MSVTRITSDRRHPHISVVIPTIPRRDHEETVRAIKQQTYEDYEIIVVNDDELTTVEARNLGIESARGSIIANTDDDCIPSKDWLEIASRYFKRDESIICIEGQITGGLVYSGERGYPTANLVYRRDSAAKVEGFSPLITGWREDTDFGWRLEEIGKCIYAPDLVVNHPDKARHTLSVWNELRLRKRHPKKYSDVIEPRLLLPRIKHWAWVFGEGTLGNSVHDRFCFTR